MNSWRCVPFISAGLLKMVSYFGILPLAQNILHQPGFLVKVKYSYDISRQDKRQRTALGYAAQKGHMSIVQLLVNKGANPNAQTGREAAAILWAALFEQDPVVRLLADRGDDIELT